MLPALRREVLWVSDSDPVIPPFKERRLLLKRIRFDEKVEIRDSTFFLPDYLFKARAERTAKGACPQRTSISCCIGNLLESIDAWLNRYASKVNSV